MIQNETGNKITAPNVAGTTQGQSNVYNINSISYAEEGNKISPMRTRKLKGAARMISDSIISSGRFLKLSDKAKILYMYLIVRTDDEGVVEAYPVMKLIGADESDLDELVNKDFVLRLNDDDVVLVLDFYAQNTLRADRTKPSRYHDLIADICPHNVADDCQQDAADCPPNLSQSNLTECKSTEANSSESKSIQVNPETDPQDGPDDDMPFEITDPLEEYQIPYIHEHMLAKYNFTVDETRLLVRLASKLRSTGVYCDEDEDDIDCMWLRNYFSAKCDYLNYWATKKDIKSPFLYMKQMVEEDLRAEGSIPEVLHDTRAAVS